MRKITEYLLPATAAVMLCWLAGTGSVPSAEAARVSPHPVLGAFVEGSTYSDTGDSDWDMPEKEQETVRKTFTLSAPAAERAVEIDNVTGSIDVVGSDADEVQLVVNQTFRAESKAKLAQARKDVTLDITQPDGSLRLYVNGPLRCGCNGGCCCGDSRDDEGYSVKMDFVVQVPRQVALRLKTVNEGEVHVKNVTGSFSVRNVNGGIVMEDVAGSGSARTVNGGVKVAFRDNPHQDSDFASINGGIELRFTKNLSADFQFKTFNGGIYSDFPVTALPVHAMQEEHRGAKVIFRANRFTGGRVGSGGPEIKVENLNGDIRILENHE